MQTSLPLPDGYASKNVQVGCHGSKRAEYRHRRNRDSFVDEAVRDTLADILLVAWPIAHRSNRIEHSLSLNHLVRIERWLVRNRVMGNGAS